MQNNDTELQKQMLQTLKDVATFLTREETKEIKVSPEMYLYLQYKLKDDIIYEDNKDMPIGYLFGVPIVLDPGMEGMTWKPVTQEKGMNR